MVTCPYCGGEAYLTTHPVSTNVRIWKCDCEPAWVSCHDGSDTPRGTLANEELRQTRMAFHINFDPLWKDGGPMRRRDAYRLLATLLDVHPTECHAALFDLPRCRAALRETETIWSLVERARRLRRQSQTIEKNEAKSGEISSGPTAADGVTINS